MTLKTANDMTIELQKVFDGLQSGEVKNTVAAQQINAVGKMIGLAKTQIEYAYMRQETPSIPFLTGSSAGPAPNGVPSKRRRKP